MQIVIISHKRSEIVGNCSFRLLPHALVSVSAEDANKYEVYAKIPRKQLLIHPNDVFGVAKKRNWVMDHIEDETCLMVDDDMDGMRALVGEHARMIKDEEALIQIFKNSEEAAKVVGTSLFCYNSLPDIRKANQFLPFVFIGYPAGIMGIIGREVRFDEHQLIHEDVDFALQVIEKHRVIWIDDRFAYVQKTSTEMMRGGTQEFNTAKRNLEERRYIKEKWGKYYHLAAWKTTGAKSEIRIDRRQDKILTPEKI